MKRSGRSAGAWRPIGWEVVIYDVVSFIGRRWHDSEEHEGRKGEVMATVTDPVCGMEIDSAAAAASEEYGGKTYYFCSEGCHQQFVAAPEQYAV